MKLIPTETDLEISFKIHPIKIDETKQRIDEVRRKVKELERLGEYRVLLKSCELIIGIVEHQWRQDPAKIDDAIHCLQKATIFLSKEKQRVFEKKRGK